eukprot:gnl/Ergobibamus_cyprinoides/24.p1 GENE.gnl/Ergobibamus_cyprinoides/24~~gnl/Ergobibamus_cyprinoides/24.p1  ORF type:complete len:267 (+),score=65.82 gnl/Ergobibamus_cyprinoides/24:108-908(+)
MGSIFSKLGCAPSSKGRQRTKITSADRAVLDIKIQRDKLTRYQRRLVVVSEEELAAARRFIAEGHPDRAKLCLRKRQLQQKLLEQSDNQLLTLQQLVSQIEFTAVQQQVVEGIAAGTEALNQLQAVISMDDIQDMLLDNQEALGRVDDLQTLLSDHLGTEDEVLAEQEFDRLRQMHLDAEMVAGAEAAPAVVSPAPVLQREPEVTAAAQVAAASVGPSQADIAAILAGDVPITVTPTASVTTPAPPEADLVADSSEESEEPELVAV